MTGVHAKCRELSLEALESLQSTKPRAVSVAVRKLEICARLLGDEQLQRWCSFHLGTYAYQIPKAPSEVDVDYVSKVVDEVRDLKVPLSSQEVRARLGNSGGGFESIEFIEETLDKLRKAKRGNDGDHFVDNLSKTVSTCANAASERAAKLYASFSFGEIPSRQFDVIRERVDNLLLDICPNAIEKFMSAYERLGSTSSEDWSLALTACRRVIKAVADVLFPPTDELRNGRKLGEEQYINRLWAFLDTRLEASSDKDLAKAHVDYLGSFIQRLNDKASKGVHATVSYEEAVRAVLYTYLTLGDILELAPAGVREALNSEGKIDINSASMDDLRNIPGLTSVIAKEVIKRRTKARFGSVEELLEIKGFGPKTLEKVQPHLVALSG
jgi:DNA uptake protein ComE-like DNA-binding protein